jgi:hypothetical protein
LNTRRVAPLLVAGLAFALAAGRSPSDPDMYWHLASGKWMLDHGAILRNDVFSSTVNGQAYSVGEWLGEIVLYLAYAAGGWTGLVLLRSALVAVSAFFVTRLALRGGTPLAIGLALATAALLLSSILWTDRPNLFSLALFPLLLDLLLAARAGRPRLLIAVPPLILVWTDLHAGYALGLVVVALFTVEALVRRGPWRAFGFTTALAAIASLLDPGALGLGAAFGHAIAPPRYIVEEMPPDVLTPAGFVFAAFVLGVIAAGMRAGGTLLDALVLIPLLALALSAQRDMPYFAFAALPYLARAIPVAVPRPPPAWRAPRGALAGATIGVVAIVAASLFAMPGVPDERAYPARAVALLDGTTSTLLNEYDWGGFLIWRAPSHPVFIDGRLLPFVPDVLADWQTAVRLGPGWRDVLARRQVATVLLRPDRPLAGALREDGWRVVGEEPGVWVLLAHP